MNNLKSKIIPASALFLKQFLSGRGLLIGGIVFYSSLVFSQNIYFDEENSLTQAMKQELTQLQWVEENRQLIVNHILNKIQTEAETMELTGWREDVGGLLMDLKAEQLLAAYNAKNYTGVVEVIRGYEMSESGNNELDMDKPVMTRGDTSGAISDFRRKSQNLVYTPLRHPCRLVDTRSPGNPHNASFDSTEKLNGRRKYSLDVSDSDVQKWGHTWRCRLGRTEQDIKDVVAVHMNIAATEAEGRGFLRVGPTGISLEPWHGILYYGPDETNIANANAAIIEMGISGDYEFQVIASEGRTHIIIDILGYFTKPPETKLSMQNHMRQTPVEPNTTAKILSPICPAGTQWTSGGVMHDSDLVYTMAIAQHVSTYNNIAALLGNTACVVQNQSNETVNVSCYAYCSIMVPD